MMNPSQRGKVLALIAIIFVLNAAASEVIAPGHNEYMKAQGAGDVFDPRDPEGRTLATSGTAFQTLLPTLLGIREVLASLMWVRADDYFHRGEYRPILTMIKEITAIDPHQLDVYATGAWHMAYNFMDKRLIQDGVEFLEDGCKKNQSVYDLYFELGYMHYDKTRNFPEAYRTYLLASEKGTTSGKQRPPSYVRHQLAHALEKMGDIDRCARQWEENVRLSTQEVSAGENAFGPASPNTAAARHNLYITLRRRNERLAAQAERARDAKEALRLWQQNVQLAQDWLKQFPGHTEVQKDLQVASSQVERLRAGKFMAPEPTDIDLRFKVVRLQPRLLEVTGKCNVLDLSRVNVRFSDQDYEERIKRGFDFKMNNCSLEFENPSVKQGQFHYTFKLNKDPADMDRKGEDIYPLKADEYAITVTYNPRVQAAFIQDRYGWNGEGLTSKPEFLQIDEGKVGVMEGKRYPLRMVQRSIILKREDILAPGKKVLYDGVGSG